MQSRTMEMCNKYFIFCIVTGIFYVCAVLLPNGYLKLGSALEFHATNSRSVKSGNSTSSAHGVAISITRQTFATLMLKQPIEKSPDLYRKFHNFFGESSKFQLIYLQSCLAGRPIFGAVLSNAHPSWVGFGSALNNALNPYVIGVQPSVNRTFRIFRGEWIYSPLSTFFTDFAENSTCPLFGFHSDPPKSSQHFQLSWNETNKSPIFSGNFTSALQQNHYSSEWEETRSLIVEVEKWNGREYVFKRKAEILRAMWNPKPHLMQLLKELWFKVTSGTGSFYGVHIRRGDKITLGEMADISVEKFHEKLLSLCNFSMDADCPKHVFLTTDDPSAGRRLVDLSSPLFRIFTLAELVNLTGRNVGEYVARSVSSSTDELVQEDKLNGTHLMAEHTMDLVLSMTLLALADHVICTFSSNLCRIVALLKNDFTFQQVHSLDDAWYPL